MRMKEKYVKVAEKWRNLSTEERKVYQEAASGLKTPEISSLDDRQRDN